MDFKQIIENLEEKQKYELTRETNIFFNQPERLFISSENAIIINNTVNPNSYNSFSVNLPKPCLNVKSLQLLSANIPKTTGLNFNDNELIFYYYRIRTQRNFDDTYTIYNEEPSIDNLYMVRLLPSYYKPELIFNNQNYGFNKTFNNYQELSDELSKACSNDLAVTNQCINSHFLANDILLRYNESYNKFEMVCNNINNRVLPSFPPIWSSSISYNINDIVYLNATNTFYISLLNNNTSNNPSSSPLYWGLYVTGENSTSKIWNTYLIAGYNDPNVIKLAEIINNNSKLFDFNYSHYGINNLVGIPPQPFTINKTLNLKLGFTWNGIYYWVDQVNIVGYTSENYEPQLYNRLRPVPQYEFIPSLGSTPLPSVGNPYKSTTFLADGYCNLVLTSTLYLYTSIIGSSTVDTIRNTNLLAIIPFDCSTLGIAFNNNFIDNPLTKISSDIYNIYFEFRNEKGELFNLGNNGTCSFVLKLDY